MDWILGNLYWIVPAIVTLLTALIGYKKIASSSVKQSQKSGSNSISGGIIFFNIYKRHV